jgi:hypothetical protein
MYVRVMIYFMYYFIIHHFDCITQSIFYLTNSTETSDEEDIGDHHDHGKPEEKPQNRDMFL